MSSPEKIDSIEFEKLYRAKLELLTPAHPMTGETGVFTRFADGVAIRPVYKAPSGQEFFHPDDESDEDLRRAGAEEIVVSDPDGFLSDSPPLE